MSNAEEPLIVNKTVFRKLKNKARQLIAPCRNVALCFNVYKVEDVLRLEPIPPDVKVPDFVIIFDVRFLTVNRNQFLGNVMYFKNSDRRKVSHTIKAYIDDLFKMKLNVVTTISSGEEEMLRVLQELQPRQSSDGRMEFSVGDLGYITHMYDPSWLLRELGQEFKKRDVLYEVAGQQKLATYLDIKNLPVDTIGEDMTTSIRKLLSKKVGLQVDKKQSEKGIDESVGTADFCFFFSQIQSTLVTSGQVLSPSHKIFWEHAVRVLSSMQFVGGNSSEERDPNSTDKKPPDEANKPEGPKGNEDGKRQEPKGRAGKSSRRRRKKQKMPDWTQVGLSICNSQGASVHDKQKLVGNSNSSRCDSVNVDKSVENFKTNVDQCNSARKNDYSKPTHSAVSIADSDKFDLKANSAQLSNYNSSQICSRLGPTDNPSFNKIGSASSTQICTSSKSHKIALITPKMAKEKESYELAIKSSPVTNIKTAGSLSTTEFGHKKLTSYSESSKDDNGKTAEREEFLKRPRAPKNKKKLKTNKCPMERIPSAKSANSFTNSRTQNEKISVQAGISNEFDTQIDNISKLVDSREKQYNKVASTTAEIENKTPRTDTSIKHRIVNNQSAIIDNEQQVVKLPKSNEERDNKSETTSEAKIGGKRSSVKCLKAVEGVRRQLFSSSAEECTPARTNMQRSPHKKHLTLLDEETVQWMVKEEGSGDAEKNITTSLNIEPATKAGVKGKQTNNGENSGTKQLAALVKSNEEGSGDEHIPKLIEGKSAKGDQYRVEIYGNIVKVEFKNEEPHKEITGKAVFRVKSSSEIIKDQQEPIHLSNEVIPVPSEANNVMLEVAIGTGNNNAHDEISIKRAGGKEKINKKLGRKAKKSNWKKWVPAEDKVKAFRNGAEKITNQKYAKTDSGEKNRKTNDKDTFLKCSNEPVPNVNTTLDCVREFLENNLLEVRKTEEEKEDIAAVVHSKENENKVKIMDNIELNSKIESQTNVKSDGKVHTMTDIKNTELNKIATTEVNLDGENKMSKENAAKNNLVKENKIKRDGKVIAKKDVTTKENENQENKKSKDKEKTTQLNYHPRENNSDQTTRNKDNPDREKLLLQDKKMNREKDFRLSPSPKHLEGYKFKDGKRIPISNPEVTTKSKKSLETAFNEAILLALARIEKELILQKNDFVTPVEYQEPQEINLDATDTLFGGQEMEKVEVFWEQSRKIEQINVAVPRAGIDRQDKLHYVPDRLTLTNDHVAHTRMEPVPRTCIVDKKSKNVPETVISSNIGVADIPQTLNFDSKIEFITKTPIVDEQDRAATPLTKPIPKSKYVPRPNTAKHRNHKRSGKNKKKSKSTQHTSRNLPHLDELDEIDDQEQMLRLVSKLDNIVVDELLATMNQKNCLNIEVRESGDDQDLSMMCELGETDIENVGIKKEELNILFQKTNANKCKSQTNLNIPMENTKILEMKKGTGDKPKEKNSKDGDNKPGPMNTKDSTCKPLNLPSELKKSEVKSLMELQNSDGDQTRKNIYSRLNNNVESLNECDTFEYPADTAESEKMEFECSAPLKSMSAGELHEVVTVNVPVPHFDSESDDEIPHFDDIRAYIQNRRLLQNVESQKNLVPISCNDLVKFNCTVVEDYDKGILNLEYNGNLNEHGEVTDLESTQGQKSRPVQNINLETVDEENTNTGNVDLESSDVENAKDKKHTFNSENTRGKHDGNSKERSLNNVQMEYKGLNLDDLGNILNKPKIGPHHLHPNSKEWKDDAGLPLKHQNSKHKVTNCVLGNEKTEKMSNELGDQELLDEELADMALNVGLVIEQNFEQDELNAEEAVNNLSISCTNLDLNESKLNLGKKDSLSYETKLLRYLASTFVQDSNKNDSPLRRCKYILETARKVMHLMASKMDFPECQTIINLLIYIQIELDQWKSETYLEHTALNLKSDAELLSLIDDCLLPILAKLEECSSNGHIDEYTSICIVARLESLVQPWNRMLLLIRNLFMMWVVTLKALPLIVDTCSKPDDPDLLLENLCCDPIDDFIYWVQRDHKLRARKIVPNQDLDKVHEESCHIALGPKGNYMVRIFYPDYSTKT